MPLKRATYGLNTHKENLCYLIDSEWVMSAASWRIATRKCLCVNKTFLSYIELYSFSYASYRICGGRDAHSRMFWLGL